MKIGIIREGKTPPDRRVPLSPAQCVQLKKQFPNVEIGVQPSKIRCFADDEYCEAGINVTEDLTDCDVLLGVKEVPKGDLIANKAYLFFAHVIKKQPYNRLLLQTILEKNIQLIDYEVLTDKQNNRIIGFGRFAGLVGAYNGLRAYGLRKGLFHLKPAHECADLEEMLTHVKELELPDVRMVVTGSGRVAGGVLEVLEATGVQRVTPEIYLATDKCDGACYTQLEPGEYVARRGGGEFDLLHFFKEPGMYENAFLPYAEKTDLLISAAFWNPAAPRLFSEEDMKEESFSIEVIADITCDIDGSIPATQMASSIAEPFYDFNPYSEELEAPFSNENNITVMAVDNLPCELPKDASLDFGRNLMEKVFPSLFGDDEDGVIARASITKNGQLTEKFSYLHDYVAEKQEN
ncbi:alanine dehydrogenase [Prolixibacteraceae bacterium JC049]|nr:alanine dehydrogenase [Prolixibacteraceae bacterium JC049]